MRYHYTPIHIAKVKGQWQPKCYKECGKSRPFIYLCCKSKMLETPRKIFQQFLLKLKMHLSYDTALSLLDIYPREMKTYVHTKTSKWIP
jgi:hypothetical protein